MKATGRVICLGRDSPVYHVLWGGRFCSPTWAEPGPAKAYLASLEQGRVPEYIPVRHVSVADKATRQARKATVLSGFGIV
jgi:hypothetical protein